MARRSRGGRAGRAATYRESPLQTVARAKDPYAGRRDSAGRSGFGAGPSTPSIGSLTGSAGTRDARGNAKWTGNTSGGGGGGSGGGGGGGGGTTGGGGGTSGTTPPADPYADLETNRLAALQAALDAIGADFNLQGQELDAEGGRMRNQFQFGMKASRYNQGLAEEGVENSMLERGMLRSGVTISDTARAQQPFVSERADLIGRFNDEQGRGGTELVALQNKRNLLGDARTAAEAQATLGSEREKLDLELMRKLAAAGLA